MRKPQAGGAITVASRRKRRAIAALAAVALVIAVGALWWWFAVRDSGHQSAPPSATPTVTLSPERARQIAEQMTSGEEAQLRKALVLPVDQPLDPGLLPGLSGVMIELDPDSYAPTGPETATVDGRVTEAAGTTTDWTFHLLLTPDAGWQVADTVPMEAG